MKTYPGADLQSDHNPVIGEYRTRLKKICTKVRTSYDIRKLKNERVKEQCKKIMNETCRNIEVDSSVEEKIKTLNTTVENIKIKVLKLDHMKHKPWMTDDIMDLVEERRKQKNNTESYKKINKEIQTRIREAKQKEIDEKCREIEILQSRFDDFNVHKKVREITGKIKKKVVGKLINERGELIVDKEDIKATWKNYVEDLFFDKRGDPPPIDRPIGPNIMTDEIKAAIKTLKEQKARGPDGMQTEFIKLLDDESIKVLCNIFNKIYDTGYIPKEWLVSEFIMLPKKQGAKMCSEFRTISLMSHLLKLFLKVIHRRIYKVCEERVANTQFGFMKGVGTRDALFSLQVLFQRCRDMSCDIYAICMLYRLSKGI